MTREFLEQQLQGNTKYLKWYLNIIENAKLQPRIKLPKTNPDYIYYEAHHILPRSLYPDFIKDDWNLVLLTAKEHFICHALLWKHYKTIKNIRGESKMGYAFNMMHRGNSGRYTSKLYSIMKIKNITLPEDVQKNINSKLNNIDENGNNGFQRQALKTIHTKLNDIDKNGLNSFQRGTMKARDTRLKDIDENGLNSFQRAARIKADIRLLDVVDSLNSFQRAAIKSVKTKKNTIINGIDTCKRAAIKSFKTKKNTIIDGIDTCKRASMKARETIKNNPVLIKQISELLSTKKLERQINPDKFKTCMYCGIHSTDTTIALYHNENCIHGPNSEDMKLKRRQKLTKMQSGKTKEQLVVERNRFKNKPILTCPHCNISVDNANYSRWHGDKCKYLK